VGVAADGVEFAGIGFDSIAAEIVAHERAGVFELFDRPG
jgi:hypothetical protein